MSEFYGKKKIAGVLLVMSLGMSACTSNHHSATLDRDPIQPSSMPERTFDTSQATGLNEIQQETVISGLTCSPEDVYCLDLKSRAGRMPTLAAKRQALVLELCRIGREFTGYGHR